MASFDPMSTATQLATAYTQAAQTQITNQTKTAQSTSAALTKLQSALRAFDTAVNALSTKKTMSQFSTTFSATGNATATATATAAPGSYPLFVEQVATAHQVVFTDLPAVPVPMSGMLSVNLAGGSSFNVDFSGADMDSDGTLSQAEIARAINQASGNQGKATAMVMTVGGQSQMVLSSGQTGADGKITLDATGLSGGAAVATLKTKLAAGSELSAAKNAIVWMGAQGSGVKLEQGSNTFTSIQGVSLTVTKAQALGDSPLNLTVATDNSGTAANLNSFIDAFNTLKTAIDGLTAPGNPKDGVAAAAFASDTTVRALRNRLNDVVRQTFGGQRLIDYGVTSNRSGQLTLDTTRLNKKLAATPDGLDTLFGSASVSARSGLLGAMETSVDTWLNSSTGQIKRRQDGVQSTQTALGKRQDRLDEQYNNAYKRYLAQFSKLQTLQAQMSQTSSIFDTAGA